MKVVIFSPSPNAFWRVPAEKLVFLRCTFPSIEFRLAESSDDLESELRDADVFFGYRLSGEQINSAPGLKWIHVPAANVYGFDTRLLQQKNIALTNSRGLHARPIAEHVIGCMLIFSRRFLDCWKLQQQHHYGQMDIINRPPPLFELRGKTVVILGVGSIGRETAKLCKALGMRVMGIKHVIERPLENVDELLAAKDFRLALPEADFLVISAARTQETEGMIGESELALLKNDAVIINIARAQIIREEPLMKVLKKGRIRGAALDVFYKEPLPSDSALFDLPNVFITPHIAGVNSTEHWNRMIDLFGENLRRFLKDDPLLNNVNLTSGY